MINNRPIIPRRTADEDEADRVGILYLKLAFGYLLIVGFLLGLSLLLSGCSSSGSKGGLSAPADMKSVAHGWVNTYKANLGNMGDPVDRLSRLTISDVPATGKLGQYPVFWFEGKNVGGLYTGSCGDSGVIRQPRMADGYFSNELLGHEVGHYIDKHARCEGGHPDYMKQAGAPSWPFFRASATETRVGDFEIVEQRGDGFTILEIVPHGRATMTNMADRDYANRLQVAMDQAVAP